jgi:hypothetical protein
VGSFALATEGAENFDGALAGGTEPVGVPGVELGDFAGPECDVVVTEDEAQAAAEHREPLSHFRQRLLLKDPHRSRVDGGGNRHES